MRSTVIDTRMVSRSFADRSGVLNSTGTNDQPGGENDLMTDLFPCMHHWGFPGIRRGVLPFMIATNCDTVRLFLNGREFHLEGPTEERNRCIKGILPYIPGCIRVEGYRNGNKVCQQTLRTPDEPTRLLFGPDHNSACIHLLESHEADSNSVMHFPADRVFRRLIGLRCVDWNGTLCFRSHPSIRFEVQGPIRYFRAGRWVPVEQMVTATGLIGYAPFKGSVAW